MYNTSMSEKRISFTEARQRFREVIEETRQTGRPAVIMRRGQPQAVLVPFEQFHSKSDRGTQRSWTLAGSMSLPAGVDIDLAISGVRKQMRKTLEARARRLQKDLQKP